MKQSATVFGNATPGFPLRFAVRERVRFQHCDPAGIAFFPRLDELLNAAFEDWCEAIGFSFTTLMQRERCGFPLVHASIDYTQRLAMGDIIIVSHHVRTIGRSSITFDVAIDNDTERCLAGTHVRVATSLDTHRAISLPAPLRAALEVSAT